MSFLLPETAFSTLLTTLLMALLMLLSFVGGREPGPKDQRTCLE